MAFGTVTVGTYPGAELSPHWPQILEMLSLGATGDGPVWEPGETVWVAIEDKQIIAAVSTCIRSDGRAQMLCIGGKGLLRALPEFEAAIVDWARFCGASEIVAERGRKGWQRFAPRMGWTFDAEIDGAKAFRKAIT